MTDTYITISALRLYCHHGAGAQERRVGNWFSFDITLHYDAGVAMQTDDVAQALNYAEIIDTVRNEAAIPSSLLEHLAARIRSALLTRHPQITSGSISVTKLAPPVPSTPTATFTIAW